jgi:Flavin-binding monooxygenase-like
MPGDRHLRICIIGAGPSGLTTTKNMLQAGLSDVTVFERADTLGGNWVYSRIPGHSSVYENVRAISSKTLSQFEDFPFPADSPHYLSQPQLLAYFEAYSDRFGLRENIRFRTEVQHIEKLGEFEWTVHLADRAVERFNVICVCNGHHWRPRMPDIGGTFSGHLLHSHDFKRPEPFRNDRVLIIGGGNSGFDIAGQMVRVAGRCSMSLRRGYHIVPRFLLGVPSDVFYAKLAWLPKSVLRKWIGRLLCAGVTAYTRRSLPKPDHELLECHPTVNTEVLHYLRKRRIKIFPAIEQFEGNRALFRDGSSAAFDTVIACTGYETASPFFARDFIDFKDDIPQLYLRMFHPLHRDLFFIGLFQPNGSIWPLSDLQAKLAANYLAGNYTVPYDVDRQVLREVETIRRSFVRSPRHNMEVNYHDFRRSLLRQIPSSAPTWDEMRIIAPAVRPMA